MRQNKSTNWITCIRIAVVMHSQCRFALAVVVGNRAPAIVTSRNAGTKTMKVESVNALVPGTFVGSQIGPGRRKGEEDKQSDARPTKRRKIQASFSATLRATRGLLAPHRRSSKHFGIMQMKA